MPFWKDLCTLPSSSWVVAPYLVDGAQWQAAFFFLPQSYDLCPALIPELHTGHTPKVPLITVMQDSTIAIQMCLLSEA